MSDTLSYLKNYEKPSEEKDLRKLFMPLNSIMIIPHMPHTSLATIHYLAQIRLSVVPHPLYSLSDFYLGRALKVSLQGIRGLFSGTEEVKERSS